MKTWQFMLYMNVPIILSFLIQKQWGAMLTSLVIGSTIILVFYIWTNDSEKQVNKITERSSEQ